MQHLHHVSGRNMFGEFPAGSQQVYFGLGCFWGAERLFWQADGVYVTSTGYGGGHSASPDYKQVCSGQTGHAELVHVVYDPATISFDALLKLFFESHDPTQGNRQGNDIGTQYRSVIFCTNAAQLKSANLAKSNYDAAYSDAGKAAITTQIAMAPEYTPAEDYHQQYLAKNPMGYCGLGGTGVVCPLPAREPAPA